MTSREDLGDRQRLLIDTCFEIFRATGGWPQEGYADKRLDRAGHDVEEVFASMPRGLVGKQQDAAGTKISLRVAGLRCCEGAEGTLDLFIRGLQWCIERERLYEPPPDKAAQAVQVTDAELRHQWTAEGKPPSESDLTTVFKLLSGENLNGGWSFNPGPPPSWSISLTRWIRRLRGINTIEAYLAYLDQDAGPTTPARAQADPAYVTGARELPSGLVPPMALAIPIPITLDPIQRGIALRLAAEAVARLSWAEMVAFLIDRGLEVSESELGRYAIATQAIARAADGELHQICEDLTLEARVSDWRIEERDHWAPTRYRLFCSHSSTDHDYVASVAAALESYGVTGFVAHRDIEPQAGWEDVIEYSLRTADALVAFVGELFPTSHWCNQEVGWALGRPILVTSIRMGHDPVGFTSKAQAIPHHAHDPRAQAKAIFDTLVRFDQGAALTRALIARLEASSDWEDAGRVASRLAACLYWGEQATAELGDVVRHFRYVRESYYVPDQIERCYERARATVPDDVAELLAATKATTPDWARKRLQSESAAARPPATPAQVNQPILRPPEMARADAATRQAVEKVTANKMRLLESLSLVLPDLRTLVNEWDGLVTSQPPVTEETLSAFLDIANKVAALELHYGEELRPKLASLQSDLLSAGFIDADFDHFLDQTNPIAARIVLERLAILAKELRS